MGRSSRNSEEKVSFFAFQDIITAVIGILVLIALILALQVNPKREKEGKPWKQYGSGRINRGPK